MRTRVDQRNPRQDDPARRASVDDFARAVHAGYLARWVGHEPGVLAREPVRAARRQPGKRSAA